MIKLIDSHVRYYSHSASLQQPMMIPSTFVMVPNLTPMATKLSEAEALLSSSPPRSPPCNSHPAADRRGA